jgi:hypothetical protein
MPVSITSHGSRDFQAWISSRRDERIEPVERVGVGPQRLELGPHSGISNEWTYRVTISARSGERPTMAPARR